jgi:outer membrane protein assembly factor BamB
MKRHTVVVSGIILAVVGIGLLAVWKKQPQPSQAFVGPELLWAFEAPKPGGVVAAPYITADAIYLPIVHTNGLQLGGTLYAIDPTSGKSSWEYDGAGQMLPSASTPTSNGQILVFGEGMHAHFACQLHAIDRITHQKRWVFPTTDHIECGPLIANERIFFTAGNDGTYAIDLASGRPFWQFAAGYHADCTPALGQGLLFIGTGPSRRFRSTEVIALDVVSGAPRWRTPVPLPAWSSPIYSEGKVYIGLGNGGLTIPAKAPETPAGGLVCLNATTGQIEWQARFQDAVFARPLLLGRSIWIGSRDGHLYEIDIHTGQVQSQTPMGSPLMTDAVADGETVFAVSIDGRICSISAVNGQMQWQYELKELAHAPVGVISPPRLEGKRLYIAAEVKSGGAAGVATLFCLQIPLIEPKDSK